MKNLTMRADDTSGLQQRATGGRKTDLGKIFSDISRQSDCAVTMLTKLSNSPTSMNFQRGKAKVDLDPRGRGGGRGEPAGPRNGESAPLNDLFAVDSETGKTALH